MKEETVEISTIKHFFKEVVRFKCFDFVFVFLSVNKHKPWIETTYHGIVTENDNTVLLDPPLIALDKDAPLRFAGKEFICISLLRSGNAFLMTNAECLVCFP